MDFLWLVWRRLRRLFEIVVVVLDVVGSTAFRLFLCRNMTILRTLRKLLQQLIRRCQNNGRRLVIAAMIRLDENMYYYDMYFVYVYGIIDTQTIFSFGDFFINLPD